MELCSIRDECQFGLSCKHCAQCTLFPFGDVIYYCCKNRKIFLEIPRVCKLLPFSKWANGPNHRSEGNKIKENSQKTERKRIEKCMPVSSCQRKLHGLSFTLLYSTCTVCSLITVIWIACVLHAHNLCYTNILLFNFTLACH